LETDFFITYNKSSALIKFLFSPTTFNILFTKHVHPWNCHTCDFHLESFWEINHTKSDTLSQAQRQIEGSWLDTMLYWKSRDLNSNLLPSPPQKKRKKSHRVFRQVSISSRFILICNRNGFYWMFYMVLSDVALKLWTLKVWVLKPNVFKTWF
jgi:hypothetical protein